MKTPEEIYDILKAQFNDAVIELNTKSPFEKIIFVDPLKINEISLFLRDKTELDFSSLVLLSGVDDANGEKVEEEEGYKSIKGGTLSVYYHLESILLRHKLVLKVSTPREKPEIESVTNVWNCANWHEREAFDLLGIKFLNHPDLRRILMPEDWDENSFPLRKDYRNPEFYQGMKVPY
jgi:NADH:ubiquinone oxidoreductase 27 kD subunit